MVLPDVRPVSVGLALDLGPSEGRPPEALCVSAVKHFDFALLQCSVDGIHILKGVFPWCNAWRRTCSSVLLKGDEVVCAAHISRNWGRAQTLLWEIIAASLHRGRLTQTCSRKFLHFVTTCSSLIMTRGCGRGEGEDITEANGSTTISTTWKGQRLHKTFRFSMPQLRN